MISRALLMAALAVAMIGCASSGPSDADQQQLAKDYSPENVAAEYDKAGKHEEAEEVRRNAASRDQQ